MRGQGSWHLPNGESWQSNRGAVTEKPGYTLHCVAGTVTVQGGREMGHWWPECPERIQSPFEVFGAERKRAGELKLDLFYFTSQFNFMFTHDWIHFGVIVMREPPFSQLLPKTSWNIFLNGMNRLSITHLISLTRSSMIINLPPSKPTAASHSALETGLMLSIKKCIQLEKVPEIWSYICGNICRVTIKRVKIARGNKNHTATKLLRSKHHWWNKT